MRYYGNKLWFKEMLLNLELDTFLKRCVTTGQEKYEGSSLCLRNVEIHFMH